MIRVGVIEAEQVEPGLSCALLGNAIVVRPHQEPAARAFFGRVRQLERFADDAVFAEHGATALVWESFATVRTNRGLDGHCQRDRHQLVPQTNAPSGGFSQKRSDR